MERLEEFNNNTVCGKCSRCGECCGKPPMPITRKEEKRIRDYITKNNIKQQPVRIWEGADNKLNVELRCCFYDFEQKRCKIYEVRPLICKSFKCDMTFKNIDDNRRAYHKRAYWNYIDKNDETHNLTNFDYLFYGDIEPLVMWFIANNINDPIFIQKILLKSNIKVNVIEMVEKINAKFKE